ncbi:hypothetical protein GCM10009558_043590 [Virgisporangium aurantiacum]
MTNCGMAIQANVPTPATQVQVCNRRRAAMTQSVSPAAYRSTVGSVNGPEPPRSPVPNARTTSTIGSNQSRVAMPSATYSVRLPRRISSQPRNSVANP